MTSFSRLTLTAALLGSLALPAMAQGGATAGTPAAAAGARASGQIAATPAAPAPTGAVVTPVKPMTPVAGQAMGAGSQTMPAKPGATPASPARTH
ncbi:MAG: hypothetical protein EXR09_05775 [Acetobacteraceae bacterium]|nr:hypothetical protein [Acetobacteraceae bacterium]